MHVLILKTSPLYLERRICCFVFCCLLCLCVFVCDCVCTCVSAVAGGKPAIYWPQTETQPGSLFLVFGQRLEMNQRTVSQSATIRSTEISDVSLLHAALLQLAAHLILIYFFFFFPPLPSPNPPPAASTKVEQLIVGYGVAWADRDKESSWHWPKYLLDYSWDTHQEFVRPGMTRQFGPIRRPSVCCSDAKNCSPLVFKRKSVCCFILFLFNLSYRYK